MSNKCPQCVAQGKTSTVHTYGGTSTCMLGDTFYDEDGNWHDHDPNVVRDEFTCSRGHTFYRETVHGCPACKIKSKVTLVFT